MEVENNAAMNQSSFSSLEENEKLFQAQPNTFGIAIESAALKELIDRDPDASTSSLSLSGQGVNLKSFNEKNLNIQEKTSTANGVSKAADGQLIGDESKQPRVHLKVCAFCQKSSDARTFVGRFCSRGCLGKNAVWHRKNKAKSALMSKHPRVVAKHSQFKDRKTASSNSKIRRRKSTFENDTDYNPITQARRKSSSGINEMLNTTNEVFSWEDYLKKENAVAVPLDVFSRLTKMDSFPSSENKFKVGHLLEAIDPEHQSLIGLVSVVNVIGQRLRLHFEGFPSIYDFWVYCNSPFIFPCGFCNKTERHFAPPLGLEREIFDCDSYAASKGFEIAPEDIFQNVPYENKTGFKILDRVEAVDRQHPELICVASITDILGDFVLVHFDGWNSYFDYWTSKNSSFIKPVGWCSKNNKELSPPLNLGELQFDWKDYLKSKNAAAADESCFSSDVHEFKVGMKLEVVDPRNLIVTRVASIAEVDDYRILIHFDGWSDLYNIWVEIDNRNLHPTGWAAKYGEILLTPYDMKEVDDQDTCSVPNCLGHGHIRHDRFVSHHSDFGCPYSPRNLKRESLSDRFERARSSTSSYDNVMADFNNHTKPDSIIVGRKRRGRPRSLSHLNLRRGLSACEGADKHLRYNDGDQKPSFKKHRAHPESSQQNNSHSMVFEAAYIASVMEKKYEPLPPVSWQKHVMSLPDIKGKTASDVNLWTVLQVASFVEQLTGKPECAEAMRCQEIDGKAFLMLNQSDITSIMKLKLGPSLKISNAILSINLKQGETTSKENETFNETTRLCKKL